MPYKMPFDDWFVLCATLNGGLFPSPKDVRGSSRLINLAECGDCASKDVFAEATALVEVARRKDNWDEIFK